MFRFFQRNKSVLAMTALVLTGSWAHAADAITDAMQAAYAPYRMALYKTNGSSQAESLQALQQAQQAWDKLATQYGAKPVSPYDRDTGFLASLTEVSRVYAKAQEEISSNQLKAAHNTLEHARDAMAQLRQRNQIVVFSDHMNAYHEAMEHILIHGTATLAQPKGLLQMAASSGVLNYLSKRLASQAPAELLQNPDFMALLKAVDQSATALDSVVMKEDAVAIKEAITKLKSPYSKLFARFG